MMHLKGKYWFKPKRFWNWFAAYYPASWQGWLATAAFGLLLIYKFQDIDRLSHSSSDTLIGFAPYAIIIFIAFDVLTRLTGEYPSWWRRKWPSLFKRNEGSSEDR